jgi:hypothetical protein
VVLYSRVDPRTNRGFSRFDRVLAFLVRFAEVTSVSPSSLSIYHALGHCVVLSSLTSISSVSFSLREVRSVKNPAVVVTLCSSPLFFAGLWPRAMFAVVASRSFSESNYKGIGLPSHLGISSPGIYHVPLGHRRSSSDPIPCARGLLISPRWRG